MCGIEGLKRLEYRGYDSAGIALKIGNRFEIIRVKGKVKELEKLLFKRSGIEKRVVGSKKVASSERDIKIGIGHTRWATHGKPSEANAHPHRAGNVILVHNGIKENYSTLKSRLLKDGAKFSSETDTEVLAHLIDIKRKNGGTPIQAVLDCLNMVEGSYAIVVLFEDMPDIMIGARRRSPLIVGIAESEFFLASDVPALLPFTKKMFFLEDGDVVVKDGNSMKFYNLAGEEIKRKDKIIDWSLSMAEKGGYKHFMLKEICEQPRAVSETMMGRILKDSNRIVFEEKGIEDVLISSSKIYIVACGTSYYAGLVGRFWFERYAHKKTSVELGSEFYLHSGILDKKDVIIAISQSGETADTLQSISLARKKGVKIIAVPNVIESSIARESDFCVYTRAGPEISVASTKAFTSQLTVLFLLSIACGSKAGYISIAEVSRYIEEIRHIPEIMEGIIKREEEIRNLAQKYYNYPNFLYLGRDILYPVALEGALKLKEISYIHAEGYPAGEMKHGPIALIDENMPVVVVVPRGDTFKKMLSNIEETKARGGRIIAIVCKSEFDLIKNKVDDAFIIDDIDENLCPFAFVLPLQLFAYYIALLRGTDIDQPRNLAKSVTVE